MVEREEKALLDRALAMMQAHDGDMYPYDLLANAALNRAIALSSGFRSLIRDRNLICAGAILRLQLDTALRFYAGFIVDDPHEFAGAVLKGEHVRRLKDQSGQLMTDRYLVQQLGKELPWVEELYEQTSGYIHLSSTHILSTFDGIHDREKRTINIKIGVTDCQFPDSMYLNAISALRSCTELLSRHIDGWIFTKNNPDVVAKLRSEREAQRNATT